MRYGNTMILNDLLAMNENPKLDFKAIWKPDDLKGELIKDIVSIANGNPQTIGEVGYLVFGVSDDKQKIKDITDEMLSIPNKYRDLAFLETTLLNTLNNHVTPDFLGLELEFIQADEKRILVITIPPHPYLLSLSKDLQLKKRTDKKGTTYYRIGEVIHSASPEVIAAFQQQLGKNNEAGPPIINNDNTKVAMQNSTNNGTQTFNL
jgi:predicted HTH transcriptional regulator